MVVFKKVLEEGLGETSFKKFLPNVSPRLKSLYASAIIEECDVIVESEGL
jgi:hypothetical protein